MVTLDTIVPVMQQNMPLVFTLLAILWGIQIVNAILGYRLNIFGIYPRHLLGLIGIPCSPFLHGNFSHLFFNSIPLFVLAQMILLYGKDTFFEVSLFIILFTGIGVWLIGRKALHVGASGVIMGYFAYLLAHAAHQGTLMALMLGGVVLYYFGGLLTSLLPSDVRTSWEAHACGFAAGLVTVYVLSMYP